MEPCPFCNGDSLNVKKVEDSYGNEYEAIHCGKCAFVIVYCGAKSESEAMERWNNRLAKQEK